MKKLISILLVLCAAFLCTSCTDEELCEDEEELQEETANDLVQYAKPVIYLYPKTATEVNVQLQLDSKGTLTTTPEPDTLIRVFMAWEGVDEFCDMVPQELDAPERNGFTVVEWGGSEVGA